MDGRDRDRSAQERPSSEGLDGALWEQVGREPSAAGEASLDGTVLAGNAPHR